MERDLTREDMERMMSANPNGEIADSEEEIKEKVYPNTAKERVEQELDELNGKIVKLTCFLYGRKIAERVVTAEMRVLMGEQLKHMQAYAETLQDRLIIWDLYKPKCKE
jgi:hypothetical protein